ncbi:hypothetical protein BDBG_17529, partial [Blastomyces gilchristii SLH14081]
SSHVDRFTFINDSEHLNVKSLIENLKTTIIKKLSVSYIIRSSISLSISSITVSLSAALSQSSTLMPVFSSLTSAILILTIFTSATSALSASATASAFIISSLCFKKMLYRLNES